LARVTYAALGLAFAALVSGFFVRDSSIPLIASIALSAAVSVLILFGWTRKMRREGFGLEMGEAEVGEIEEIALVEFDEVGKLEGEEVAVEKKRGRRLGKVMAGISRRPAPDDTIVEAPIVEPAVRTPRPKPATARPATAKPTARKPTAAKPASPRPKPLAKQKPSVRPKVSVAAGGRSRRKVFVIPGRERYHSADCRYAHGDDLREVSEDLARRRGYTPCGLCLKK
jgi:outer membrane biosynthesis protein TonB